MSYETARERIARQLRTGGVLVQCDSRGRFTVPNGRPHQRYSLEEFADGTFLLRPLSDEPEPPLLPNVVDVRDPGGRL